MCTVSFIARRHGYALGMNRDEKRSRASGLAPDTRRIGDRTALCPAEPSGGTWVGVNDSGVTLALVNWYSVTNRVGPDRNPVSRGDLVKTALGVASSVALSGLLNAFPLDHVNPFRLIGVFPEAGELLEWRWDLRELRPVMHPWRTGIWISSGFDEPGAQQTRGKTFGAALRQKSAGSLDWMRRLHRSHQPERGPYSLCMHREDAATVSYTEIVVSRRSAAMRYINGPPCCQGISAERRLELSVRTPFQPGVGACQRVPTLQV